MNATLAIAQLDDKNQHNTLLHQIHKKYDLGSLLRNMIEEVRVNEYPEFDEFMSSINNSQDLRADTYYTLQRIYAYIFCFN